MPLTSHLGLDTPFLIVAHLKARTTKRTRTMSTLRQTRLPIDWIVEAEEGSSSSDEEEEVVQRSRLAHPL